MAPVMGDRVQLQQLVLNLILNGIEAMDPVPDHSKNSSSARNATVQKPSSSRYGITASA